MHIKRCAFGTSKVIAYPYFNVQSYDLFSKLTIVRIKKNEKNPSYTQIYVLQHNLRNKKENFKRY